MQQDLRSALVGALAGALATLPMSAVMLTAQRAGFLGESPPRLLSSAALGAHGNHDPGEVLQMVVATELHLAIGVANGAAFGLLGDRLNLPFPAPINGALFGTLVWALAYRGWMPMMKIMPPIERDRPDRQVVMFVSHLVYGGVLGLAAHRFSR